MSFCSPLRFNDTLSCFNVDELTAMAIAWNATNLGKKTPINLLVDHLVPDYKKYLWECLSERFKPYCGSNESCWLDAVEFSKELKKLYPTLFETITYFTLKPKGTKGTHDWLSTSEIDLVMQQYEKLFTEFKYIGCFPSDYYNLYPSKFPFDILKNYIKSAIIFNLDSSHQRGSHWIAVFFERDPTTDHLTVEYFDPTGDKPNKNLSKFLDHPAFENVDVLESTFSHQKGNNECGMFSMFYVLERLNGKTLEEINESRITDKSMNEFRSFVFRPYTERFSMEHKFLN